MYYSISAGSGYTERAIAERDRLLLFRRRIYLRMDRTLEMRLISRVGMILPEYPISRRWGGLATHVNDLVEGLSSRGVHVLLILLGSSFLPSSYSRANLDVFVVTNDLVSDPDGAINAALDLIRGLETKPAIFHQHFQAHADLMRQISEEFEIPIVYTVHLLADPLSRIIRSAARQSGGVNQTEDKDIDDRACKNADILVAVSHYMRNLLMSNYGRTEDTVPVVYNGVSVHGTIDPPCDAEAKLLKSRFAPNSEKVIIYAGRLAPQKGVSALIRSAMRVTKSRTDVSYVIAGRENSRPVEDGYYKSMASGSPVLAERMHFVGLKSPSELLALYRLASIAIVPSLHEPFGYAAIEAMAAGVATIASQTGGLEEIIEHGVSGLLVPLCNIGEGLIDVDVLALERHQHTLLDDRILRRRLAEAGRLRVQNMFRLDVMIDKTVAAYQSAISLRKKKHRSAPVDLL